MASRFKWVFLAFLAVVAGHPERCAGELPGVRIGLLWGQEEVAFSGPAGVTIQRARSGKVVAWAPPGERWEIRAQRGAMRLIGGAGRDWSTTDRLRLLPPEGGVVTVYGVGGHWDGVTDRDYRGVIEVLLGAGRSLTVVNLIDTETYLRGVVPSEMPSAYPLAALQSQAVAARGQALIKAGRHRAAGFDLCRTEHCQVYGGATRESASSDQAVASTRGQVLEYEGRLADTLYSSNCGGHTVNNEDYWPDESPVPYLRAAPDFDEADLGVEFPLAEAELGQYLKYAPVVNCNQPRRAKASKFRWWSVMPSEELRESLASEVGDFGELLDVRVTDRAESGIVREVAVIGRQAVYKIRGGAAVRRGLGGSNSASFAIEPIGRREEPPIAFVVWGAGWGHQVGMCQVGAAGLAGEGWDYWHVLAKYYRGCDLVRRY
jgi:SpoIID/LytB domain protein